MHCLSCQADPAVYSSSQFCPVETLILLSRPPKADLFVSPRLASCPVQPLGHGCFPGLDLQEHLLSTLQLASARELTLHTPVPQGPPALYLFPRKRGQSSSTSRAGIVGNNQWTIGHAEGVLGTASTPVPPAGCSSWTGHCKIALASAAALCAGTWVSVLEKAGAVNVSGGSAQPQGGQGAWLGTRGSPDVGCASSTSSTAHGPGPHRRAHAAGSSRTPTRSTGHREESRSCCVPGGRGCEGFPPPRPQDSVTFNCGPCPST